MIAHVSIGVLDVKKSKSFYDAALEPLGYKCIRAARTFVGYGYGAADSISFWVAAAERPVPVDEKSGLHFCFAAPDPASVDAFHATALRSLSIRTDTGSKPITVQARREGCSAFKPDRHPLPRVAAADCLPHDDAG